MGETMSLITTENLSTAQLEDLAGQDAKEAHSFYLHWLEGIGVAGAAVLFAVGFAVILVIKSVF